MEGTNVDGSELILNGSESAKQEYSWESFTDIKTLGDGSFGTVYKARKIDTNKWYVIKEIDTTHMNEEQSLAAIEEIEVQGRCSSPYIVKYYDSFIDDVGKLNIVMEYCDHGDLHSYLERCNNHLSEVKIWKFFVQITLGLNYLHSMQILHRDMKSLNVFLTKEYKIKIGDLGEATIIKNNKGDGAVGTPYYFAPELCNGNTYTDKCDIWSLGCILYEMCCLKKPFEAENYEELKVKICAGEYDPLPKMYSNELSNLIQKMLTLDPEERPNTDEIISSKVFQRHLIVLNLSHPSKTRCGAGSQCSSFKESTPSSAYIQNESTTKKSNNIAGRKSIGSDNRLSTMESDSK